MCCFWFLTADSRRLLTTITLVVAVCMGSGTAAFAASTLIDLRDDVVAIDQPVIRLVDVARITTADPQLGQRLEQLLLAPAPAAGRTSRLTFDELRQRLQAAGINLAEVEFRGSRTIQVRGTAAADRATDSAPVPVLPATAAPTTAHRRQAEQKLVAAFQQQYRPADASLGALLVRFEVPDDAVAATLRAAPHQLAFRDVEVRQGGPQVLTVVCTSDEASVAAEWGVRAWVTTPPQVLAVRHAVPKGVVLQPGDLVWQPLGDGEPAGLQQLQQAVGKEATRSLRPGQRLLASDLADVPLVRAQDIVTGLVRRPGLTVKRQFKAVTAGALYEPVQLVALDDPRLKLQGVVSGYHEVTLFSSDELPRPVDAGGPKGALP